MVFLGLPFFLFYYPIKRLVMRLVLKKREKSLKKSFVKIKGNDVVTTSVVMYSLILIPLFLSIYAIMFFCVLRYWFCVNLGLSIRFTIDFVVIMPIYMYFSVTLYDQYMYYSRILMFRLHLYMNYRNIS